MELIPIIHEDGRILFDIGLEFEKDLENGNFSERRRQQFENKGAKLPQNITIQFEKEYDRWVVSNEDGSILYVIRKEDERLNIYDDSIVVKGFAERKWAEKQNLCHLTTLLIPIKADENGASRTVQIQVRDKEKSFPCCRDIFGGHVNLDSEFWSLLLGQSFDLSQIVSEAAVREANEELRMCKTGNSDPYIITSRDLHKVGEIGEARWKGKGNVERSTIFLVPIPDNCVIRPMDDIEGIFVSVKTQTWNWKQLRKKFLGNPQYACYDRTKACEAGCRENKQKWQFADGAARILDKEALFNKVAEDIDRLPKNVFNSI